MIIHIDKYCKNNFIIDELKTLIGFVYTRSVTHEVTQGITVFFLHFGLNSIQAPIKLYAIKGLYFSYLSNSYLYS